jgi:hypothetical protein
MPQAKRGTSGSSGSSSSSSRATRSSSGKSGGGSAGRSTTRKTSSSRSSSGPGSRSSSSSAAGSRSTRSAKSGGSTASRSRATSAPRSAASKAAASSDVRIDAIANRVRKLNERIIEAGREAGETTLTTYEKALKTIASGIEKGPGRSEIDWISNLATAQAKFIRDLTNSWTSTARGVLKH